MCRCTSSGRRIRTRTGRDAIQPALDALLGVVDDVFDISLSDALRARDVVLDQPRLTARDALHIAVMEREGVETTMTFDSHFDLWAGIRRIS